MDKFKELDLYEDILPIVVPVAIFSGIAVGIAIFFCVVCCCPNHSGENPHKKTKKRKTKQLKIDDEQPLLSVSAKKPLSSTMPRQQNITETPLKSMTMPPRFESPRKGYYRPMDASFDEISPVHLKIDDAEVVQENDYSTTKHGHLKLNDGSLMPVTVKSAKTSPSFDDNQRVLSRELDTLDCVVHGNPHVVRLIGAVTLQPGQFHIVTEHCPGGTLLDYVQSMRDQAGDADVAELLQIVHKIATGLKLLNERKSVHTSLTASDILLTNEKTPKIGGFGFHRHSNAPHEFMKISPKPWQWVAHEVLSELNPYVHPGADIWSFGVLLWEVFSLGEVPYAELGEDKPEDFERSLMQGDTRLDKPLLADDKLYELMMSCWNSISFDRPSFDQLAKGLASIARDAPVKATVQEVTETEPEPVTEEEQQQQPEPVNTSSSSESEQESA